MPGCRLRYSLSSSNNSCVSPLQFQLRISTRGVAGGVCVTEVPGLNSRRCVTLCPRYAETPVCLALLTALSNDLFLTRLISMPAVGITPTVASLFYAEASGGPEGVLPTLTPGGCTAAADEAASVAPSRNWDRDELVPSRICMYCGGAYLSASHCQDACQISGAYLFGSVAKPAKS